MPLRIPELNALLITPMYIPRPPYKDPLRNPLANNPLTHPPRIHRLDDPSPAPHKPAEPGAPALAARGERGDIQTAQRGTGSRSVRTKLTSLEDYLEDRTNAHLVNGYIREHTSCRISTIVVGTQVEPKP
ncbi:hypothetical protein BJX66DRAFT_332279 [Aspergillus keveii]|uniref:Uncharacterized protein n=1 Tax=Aspergillus keveii TaxID=714993 RepID=A0ABR4GM26_9EURO